MRIEARMNVICHPWLWVCIWIPHNVHMKNTNTRTQLIYEWLRAWHAAHGYMQRELGCSSCLCLLFLCLLKPACVFLIFFISPIPPTAILTARASLFPTITSHTPTCTHWWTHTHTLPVMFVLQSAWPVMASLCSLISADAHQHPVWSQNSASINSLLHTWNTLHTDSHSCHVTMFDHFTQYNLSSNPREHFYMYVVFQVCRGHGWWAAGSVLCEIYMSFFTYTHTHTHCMYSSCIYIYRDLC